MLYKRLTKDLFKDLSDAGIIYSLLEWTETNETIVFIEKDNSIYSTIYSNDSDTFTDAFVLVDGTSASPTRDGDYVVLEYIFNEKSQQLDVLYTDIVTGIKQQPVDLWDGILNWEFSPIHKEINVTPINKNGDYYTNNELGSGLRVYDQQQIPPAPINFIAEGMEFDWNVPTIVASTLNPDTIKYRIYEDDIFILEVDRDTLAIYDLKANKTYSIEAIFEHIWSPSDTFISTRRDYFSGNQSYGVDTIPQTVSLFIPDVGDDSANNTFSFYDTRPIYTPFQYDYSTFIPVTTQTIIINTNESGCYSNFGLVSVDTRIDIIPVFTELYTDEIEYIESEVSTNFVVSIEPDTFVYTDYFGNFIV